MQEHETPSRPLVSEPIAMPKPAPTSPSTAPSGTKQSSNVRSASLIASEPIVVSTRVTLNPGVPRSTRNAVMPPRARFAGSVTAITSTTSARCAPLMYCLRPLRIQPPSPRVARVRIAAASEPASGSVSANEAFRVPVARPRTYLRFCSALPDRAIAIGVRPLVASRISVNTRCERANSSSARQ